MECICIYFLHVVLTMDVLNESENGKIWQGSAKY